MKNLLQRLFGPPETEDAKSKAQFAAWRYKEEQRQMQEVSDRLERVQAQVNLLERRRTERKPSA